MSYTGAEMDTQGPLEGKFPRSVCSYYGRVAG